MAFAKLDLYFDTQCDYVRGIILLGGGSTFVGLSVTAAVLTIKATPLDPAPLVRATLAGGQLTFGVAPPPPVGAQCACLAELDALGGPPLVDLDPPAPVVLTVATLAALAAADTSPYALGDCAFVQAGQGAYYAWSPLDPNTPNGTTIIAGLGGTGNWLLAVTVQVSIPLATLVPLVGTAQATYSLLVTWSQGGTSSLLEGTAYIDQSTSS